MIHIFLEEEEALTHNIKLLSLRDLNLWQKKVNVSMINFFYLNDI